MKQPVQIFPTQTHSYSDVYASREKTKYRIGRPDGSPMMCFNISEKEAVTILTSLPNELLEIVKDHYGLEEPKPFDPSSLSNELLEYIKEHYGLTEGSHFGVGEVDRAIPIENEEDTKHPEYPPETEEDTTTPVEEGISLEEMTRDQLRDLCKQLEIKGYGKWSKEEMIKAIETLATESDDE